MQAHKIETMTQEVDLKRKGQREQEIKIGRRGGRRGEGAERDMTTWVLGKRRRRDQKKREER